ncbi:unnamed protein product [Lactuca saligna]|uniref:Uncharacterized protein n=1 Tax=Lactuca saligna TaxID=75948 RepID=A0AA35Y8R8_LACSI|nr:unnamed protein product [Lactuca saligna]
MLKGTQGLISEHVIREVLEFGDASAFLIEYSVDQVKEVLAKMCYDGTYPPTIKKLLPPYGKFLVHSFVIGISGRKGGSDEIIPVDIEPPSSSNLEDSAHTFLLRKRKRRDLRPRELITYSIQKKSTPIEPDSMAQNIPSSFTETSPVTHKMSSLFTESIPMYQDFESPIAEEEVIPSEGAHASRSSFETPELDISKGKSKLPESELVDVVLLQNRVYDLEQSSAETYLIIGKHDIQISELEKENSIKDSNISELKANLGGVTALFFDLKQCLFQKFGDEFQPLSSEGEKITASSSSPANPTSQSSSERAVRPSPDANLDSFLSSGPDFAQERRDEF